MGGCCSRMKEEESETLPAQLVLSAPPQPGWDRECEAPGKPIPRQARDDDGADQEKKESGGGSSGQDAATPVGPGYASIPLSSPSSLDPSPNAKKESDASSGSSDSDGSSGTNATGQKSHSSAAAPPATDKKESAKSESAKEPPPPSEPVDPAQPKPSTESEPSKEPPAPPPSQPQPKPVAPDPPKHSSRKESLKAEPSQQSAPTKPQSVSAAQPLSPLAKEAKAEERCWDRVFSTETWGPTDHTSCTEYRIHLPLSVAEFEKAQIHAVNEGSKKVTGGGNGVEVVRNETFGPRTENNSGPPPYGLPGNSGMYTHKIYRLKHMVPGAVRAILSEDLLTMEERAWNAYPLCKTLAINRKWPIKDCLLQISTLHSAGPNAQLPNALCLPEELLKIRKVNHIDITDDALIGGRKSKNYQAEEDPKLLRTWDGRGPFLPGWEKTYTGPQMVIYKVVAIRLRFALVEGRLRSWMLAKSYPNIFSRTHRFALCSYDIWSRLSLAELREIEKETAKQLQDQMKKSGKGKDGAAVTLES